MDLVSFWVKRRTVAVKVNNKFRDGSKAWGSAADVAVSYDQARVMSTHRHESVCEMCARKCRKPNKLVAHIYFTYWACWAHGQHANVPTWKLQSVMPKADVYTNNVFTFRDFSYSVLSKCSSGLDQSSKWNIIACLGYNIPNGIWIWNASKIFFILQKISQIHFRIDEI